MVIIDHDSETSDGEEECLTGPKTKQSLCENTSRHGSEGSFHNAMLIPSSVFSNADQLGWTLEDYMGDGPELSGTDGVIEECDQNAGPSLSSS